MKHLRLAAALIILAAPPASAAAEPLSYTLAMRQAVEGNYALLIDRMSTEVVELRAKEARRPYVPVVFVEPELVASQSAVRTSASETPEILRQARLDASGGVRWETIWGTSLALRAATTPWYSSFAPTPLTTLEASVNQPLLRNTWGSSTLLEVVDLDVELQRHVFVAALNDLLVRVDAAYWELAYAQADVDIKQKSRDRAQQQFEDTRENIARGLLAPGDIFVVEENVVIFDEQLLRSKEALQLARLRLGRLLQAEAVDELTATESLDAAVSPAASTADEIALALRENPRIAAQRVALQQAGITLAFDRNQTRPVLDVGAGLGFNGLSEDYGESWGETLSGEYPVFRLGLYFEVPLVGGPYRARVKRSELAREQEVVRLREVESDVTFDVREITTQLESRTAALDLARRRVELAEKKLETEQDKYARGLSTLTDLVRFQRDLDSARISERRARVEALSLRARLAAAQGVLHTVAGVEVR